MTAETPHLKLEDKFGCNKEFLSEHKELFLIYSFAGQWWWKMVSFSLIFITICASDLFGICLAFSQTVVIPQSNEDKYPSPRIIILVSEIEINATRIFFTHLLDQIICPRMMHPCSYFDDITFFNTTFLSLYSAVNSFIHSNGVVWMKQYTQF